MKKHSVVNVVHDLLPKILIVFLSYSLSLETCKVAAPMKDKFSVCNGYYSMFNEDNGDYTVGWKRANKSSNTTISPWYYQPMSELGGVPFLGVTGTYGGGGYSFDLAFSNLTEVYLNSLKQNYWIDARTRAIFVEIAIYSPQVNLFGVATFLTEWIPTNGIIYFNNIKVARLYRYGNNFHIVMLVCEIFLAIFFAVFLYTEIKQFYKLRKEYFKDPWNWLEISQIILILTGAAALLQRTFFTQRAINRMKSNPGQFISFIQATTWDEIFGYLLAFLVFFANLKLLKLLRFNHRIYLFTKTLSKAAMPLFSFLIVFFVFYIAYSILHYFLFGPVLDEYKSFVTTIETLFSTVMGVFDFEIIRENNRILGPIIFFSFNMIMVMILMNVFLTILMDAFAEVQADENLKSKDYEVIEYMLQQFRFFFVRSGKVGNFFGNNMSENGVDLTNELDCSQSCSETNTCLSPDENWQEGSQDKQIRTVKAARSSFSSINNARDSFQIRHDESRGEEENLSTWPSSFSLCKENFDIRNFEGILSYSGEPGKSINEENTSCIFPASAQSRKQFSRKSSVTSQTEDGNCESHSGSYSPWTKYSHSNQFSTATNSLADLKSWGESSSSYYSAFAGTENSNIKSEISVESEVSHFYDLLDRAADKLSFRGNGTSLMSKDEDMSVDPDLHYYYQLLENAAKEQNQNEEDMLNAEKFDFTDYQVCFNNLADKPEEVALDRSLEVEPKLSDLLRNFASIAISEIQEDQIYEQLFISYVTAMNEVKFEPDYSSMERKLFKRFAKKTKWKYTRHMYPESS